MKQLNIKKHKEFVIYYIVSPFSLVVEHQSCKLEVASSILAGGFGNILYFFENFYVEVVKKNR